MGEVTNVSDLKFSRFRVGDISPTVQIFLFYHHNHSIAKPKAADDFAKLDLYNSYYSNSYCPKILMFLFSYRLYFQKVNEFP